MLKKTQRFSFKKGFPKSKLISPLFVVRFQKSESPTYAVVVSKSVSKKAVVRNSIKRRFTKELQDILSESTNSFDLLFFLRKNFQEYNKSGIINELHFMLKKINS